jgi:hypothetical protein
VINVEATYNQEVGWVNMLLTDYWIIFSKDGGATFHKEKHLARLDITVTVSCVPKGKLTKNRN